MKKKRIIGFGAVVSALALLTACAGGSNPGGAPAPGGDSTSGSGETFTIRYGSAVSPESIEGKAMEVFKDYVEEASDGRLIVETYPGGALGGAAEGVQQAATGAIDMNSAAPSWWQTISAGIGVAELPYLFGSRDEAFEALEGDLGEMIADEMLESDLVALGWYDLGFRHVINNTRAIESREDLGGMTLRFQDNPTHLDAFVALGANPIVLDWTEVYPSMESGVVDGLENGLATLIANNFDEVGSYLSLTQHVYGSMVVMMNRQTWESLPEDLQEVVRQGVAAEVEYQRDETLRLEEGAIAEFEAAGVEVNELDEAALAEMKEIARGIYEDHADRIGRDLVDKALDSVDD